MRELIDKLLQLHRRGSLHVMDGGNICVGCGGQWPCRTVEILNQFALDALKDGS